MLIYYSPKNNPIVVYLATADKYGQELYETFLIKMKLMLKYCYGI